MRAKLLAILASLPALVNFPTAAASWEPLPSLPVGNGNGVGGMMGNDLIIAGGITWEDDTKIWLDKIWRFDTRQKVWSEAGRLPHPLAYPAYGQTARGIYFTGGSDGRKSLPVSGLLNHQLEFQKLGKVPQPLVCSASALAVGKLYVVAGATDVADLKSATNLFYSVHLKTGRVEALRDFPGGNLFLPVAAALGGRIYVFGGAAFDPTNSQPVNSDSAFVYSIADAKWSGIKSFPFSVRGLAGCVLDDRHILLAGGYKQEFTDEAFVYDTRTDTYSKTAPLPYRAMVQLVKADGEIYCIGGEDRMRHRSDLFYRIAGKALLKEANQP